MNVSDIQDLVFPFIKSSTSATKYCVLCPVNKSFRNFFKNDRIVHSIQEWFRTDHAFELFKQLSYTIRRFDRIDNTIVFEISTGRQDFTSYATITIENCDVSFEVYSGNHSDDNGDMVYMEGNSDNIDQFYTTHTHSHIRTLKQFKEILRSSYYHPDYYTWNVTYTTSYMAFEDVNVGRFKVFSFNE